MELVMLRTMRGLVGSNGLVIVRAVLSMAIEIMWGYDGRELRVGAMVERLAAAERNDGEERGHRWWWSGVVGLKRQ